MATVDVKVKWGKEKFDVQIMLDEPAEVFKAQLFALTGVPPDRQKITAGTKKINDDTDLKSLNLKDKQMLMLFGTADEILQAPTEKPIFVEDLAPSDMAGLMAAGVPFGLENLGNTCYMNSCLQVVNNVNELVESLSNSPAESTQHSDPYNGLVVASKNLFKRMQSATEPIAPGNLLMQLRLNFPQFDERGEGGMHMQQDAEECLSQLLQVYTQKIKTAEGKSFIEDLFGVELDVEVKCAEGDEPAVTEKEKQLKISCHIQGPTPQPDGSSKGGTDFVTQSISLGLESSLEKNSPSLGRTALYKKTSKISRVCLSLPKYLLLHFVRFQWRQDTGKKAKILRAVKFPFLLDMRDFCTDEYKSRIDKWRNKEREANDERQAALRRRTETGTAKDESESKEGAKGEEKKEETMEVEGQEEIEETEDLWSTYELTGVITHKGRTADGGHYVAWIKKDSGKWFLFDDAKVSEIEADEVKKLYGGGDWHMAYMCLYKRVRRPLDVTKYE
ncbi:hypothetical protein GUITHDRAFT_165362 [Guillardia theta CCMP2712]|uniref:Ubiquitin carboxyl-terminal hydrolase n=1 Tax=Guillardia theta (strain CCMP2712) TaxID=905079 RepID=L1INJ6_GUITC|nr:hypothetical protein GUITHDRAFT_165362 [Guillardia theta CCMP2712]EKX37851.1 hypothetical protein GUITHDRAFT_165362 [Guillardia theta CCMP2712]|eukprot:XP_005824831.1 hypothetical protein GUITHDRAFT_165362 [Guillardia theta CCMP2712]